MNKTTDLTQLEIERLQAEGIDLKNVKFLGAGKNNEVYRVFKVEEDPRFKNLGITHQTPMTLTIPYRNPSSQTFNAQKNRSKYNLNENAVNMLKEIGVNDAKCVKGEGRMMSLVPWPSQMSLETLIENEGQIADMETARPIIFGMLGDLCKHERAGILHRDIKPDNVAVTWHIGGFESKFIDYELAGKVSEVKESPLPTRGTGAYSHPSLLNAWVTGTPAKATQKTELYSLGASIYEMLTGKRFSNRKIVDDPLGREVELDGRKSKISLTEETVDGSKRLEKIDALSEDEMISERVKDAPQWAQPFLYRCLTDGKKGFKSYEEANNYFIRHTQKVEGRKGLKESVLAIAASFALVAGLGYATQFIPEIRSRSMDYNHMTAFDRLHQMGQNYLDSSMNKPIKGEEAK